MSLKRKDWQSCWRWLKFGVIPWIFKDLWIYDIPHFLKNLWKFKGQLWDYKTWDFMYILRLLVFAINDHKITMKENAHFIGYKKVVKEMDRVVIGLNRLISDNETPWHLEKMPKELWPCRCSKNKKTAMLFGPMKNGFGQIHFVDDSNATWFPCHHTTNHCTKIEKELGHWVFNEIAKKYRKWWD